MTTVSPRAGWPTGGVSFARSHGFLLVAFAAWLAPPLLTVAQRYWSTEQGAAGPLILVTGCWALAYQGRRLRHLARPGALPVAATVLLAAGIVYVLARMVGMPGLELLAAFGGGVAVAYGFVGTALLRRLAIPIAYLVFVIPPPYSLTMALAEWLKPWLARVSVDLLSAAGMEVANDGTALFVDGYQLLVETACSGLTSLITLCAVGLFYIYWRGLEGRRARREAIVLALLLPPIAIIANLMRVMLLLWAVRMRGTGVLSSAVHPAAGIAMFAVALLMLMSADGLIRALRRARAR